MNTQNALITILSISTMGNSRKDAGLTDQIHTENGMAQQAGHYQKHLLPPDCLKPITKLRSACRSDHEKQTFMTPFGSILPAAQAENYSGTMNQWRSQWQAAVRSFIADYDRNIARAQSILGPAFDRDLYPTIQELPGLFKFEYQLLPLPTPDALDGVTGLANDRVAMLKRQLAESTQLAALQARTQLMERVTTSLERVFQMCASPDARVDPRTLDNLEEILNLAPSYNLTNDATINRLVEDARRTLTLARDTIKNSPAARQRNVAALEVINKAYGLQMTPRKIAKAPTPAPAGTSTEGGAHVAA